MTLHKLIKQAEIKFGEKYEEDFQLLLGVAYQFGYQEGLSELTALLKECREAREAMIKLQYIQMNKEYLVKDAIARDGLIAKLDDFLGDK